MQAQYLLCLLLRLLDVAQMGVVCCQHPTPFGRIAHPVDGGDDILMSAQRAVGVGKVPEIPVRIVRVEPHRPVHQVNGTLALADIDQGVRIFGQDVGIVWIKVDRTLIGIDRGLVLLPIEVRIAQLGEAAGVGRVLVGGGERQMERLVQRVLWIR